MNYVSMIIAFLPLIVLLWLANIADKRQQESNRRGMSILVYGLLGMLWLTALAAGLFALLMGIAYKNYADLTSMTVVYQNQGLNPDIVIKLMHSLPKMGAGILLLALMGIATLLKPIRKVIARAIPIDYGRTVHTVALSYAVLIFIIMWVTMSMGMDLMLEAMANTPDIPISTMLAMLWLQNILLAIMAMIGVGWLSRRSLQDVIVRLGLTMPRWQDVLRGIGLALISFAIMAPILFLAEKLGLGVDPNIEKISEELLGPLTSSLPGILSLGFAAALGEELVYRGALQPRFGIVLTAILFSLTHNQYGLSVATLVVFLLGLLLGWTRKKYNTTTSIFLHATYNIIIGLSAYLLQ